MTEWTRDMVEERVLEAAGVLKKLPGPRAQGYFSTWPDMLLSAREIARQEPKPMKVLPSPQAISRMEETLTWNRFLEPDEAHLMWARAEGVPWKGICYRFGISRPTAHRRYDYALSVIAWRLNGRQVHHRRGRRFVVARACQSRFKKGPRPGGIVGHWFGLARALARVPITWLTRDKAHWPKASPSPHPSLIDQALSLRLCRSRKLSPFISRI